MKNKKHTFIVEADYNIGQPVIVQLMGNSTWATKTGERCLYGEVIGIVSRIYSHEPASVYDYLVRVNHPKLLEDSKKTGKREGPTGYFMTHELTPVNLEEFFEESKDE